LAISVDLPDSHATSPGKLEEVLAQCYHCVLAFLGALARGGRDSVLPSWEAQSQYWFHIQANSSGYQPRACCVNQMRVFHPRPFTHSSCQTCGPILLTMARSTRGALFSRHSNRFCHWRFVLVRDLPRASVTRIIDTSC
jgi:hypothetical protein